MKGMRNIAPYGVRMPDALKERLTLRAHRNGRSMNSEIVMILQDAIDQEDNPKGIDDFVQAEADKFKEALLETLKTMYDKKDG